MSQLEDLQDLLQDAYYTIESLMGHDAVLDRNAENTLHRLTGNLKEIRDSIAFEEHVKAQEPTQTA